MRVLVIGGHGHLGSSVVRALHRLEGMEVSTGGRSSRNDVRLDLERPDSFSALDTFEVVINCSDSLAAPPDALVQRCIERGPTLLETTADPVTIRRLVAAPPSTGGVGAVLLGAGLFPGLSNLIAAAAIADVERCTSVELAIRWNPMSAGGGGMVALVPHLLRVATHRQVGGRLVEGPSMGPGPRLPFSDGEHACLHLPFTEPTMLAQTQSHVRDIAVFGSLDPDVMMDAFGWVPLRVLQNVVARWLMWLQFTALRRLLLRRVRSRDRIVARATNEACDAAVRTFETTDGIAAAGDVTAAQIPDLLQAKPGLHLPDGLSSVEAIRKRLEGLPGHAESSDMLFA